MLLDHCLLTVNLEHITLLMHFICSVYVYVCAILYCSDANLHLGVLVSSWSRPQDKKIIGYMIKNHAFNSTTSSPCIQPYHLPPYVLIKCARLSINNLKCTSISDIESFWVDMRCTLNKIHIWNVTVLFIAIIWLCVLGRLYRCTTQCIIQTNKKTTGKNANKNVKYFHSALRVCHFIVN